MPIVWEKPNGTKLVSNEEKDTIEKAKELGWKKLQKVKNFPPPETIEATAELEAERAALEKEKAELAEAKAKLAEAQEELDIDKAAHEDAKAAHKDDGKDDGKK